MTETKWTPGPWKIDGPDYFKNFTLTGEGETLAIAAVCNGETRQITPTPLNANAWQRLRNRSGRTMTDIKLTPTQKAALRYMLGCYGYTTSAYDLNRAIGGNICTLNRLCFRGLVIAIGIGHVAFPRTADWKLTPKGVEIAKGLAND